MNFWEGFWNILWWTLWISIFVSFLFLLFRIILDVFRDRSLSGWARLFWVIFIIFLPIIGSLVYLIARGQGMYERDLEYAAASRAAQVDYVRGLIAETKNT